MKLDRLKVAERNASDALLDCDCAGWVENLPRVNAFITFGLSHSMFYEGEQFLFCPWCGKKRVQSNNHPSGDPTPSAEDIRITRQLAAAGKVIDISVLDHVIVAGSKSLSMREQGLVEF